MSTSSKPTQFSQDLLENFHPRKFLLYSSLYQTEASAISPAPENSYAITNNFDTNVLIVISILICSLISFLGLFCIVKCALKCSSLVAAEPDANRPSKLANAGVEQKALKAFRTVKFTSELRLRGLDTACVLCLSEFAAGECLRILPKCNHGFHTRCIDQWLSAHSSCPTCRHCLTETDQKTVKLQPGRLIGAFSPSAGKQAHGRELEICKHLRHNHRDKLGRFSCNLLI